MTDRSRHELSLYEYLHMGGNTQGLVRFTSYRAVRVLESWHRQTVLCVPPGLDRRGRMQDVKLALRIKRYR